MCFVTGAVKGIYLMCFVTGAAQTSLLHSRVLLPPSLHSAHSTKL